MPDYITLHSQCFSAVPFPADTLRVKPVSLKHIVSGLVYDELSTVHEQLESARNSNYFFKSVPKLFP